MSSTINLAATVNWALPFLSYKPVNQGINNEPAISCANTVLQTILGPPFSWRWNRASLTFYIEQSGINNHQDTPSALELAATWQPVANYVQYTIIVDSNGNLQQLTTASGASKSNPHPVWSTVIGGTTADASNVWTLINPYDFGFLEKSSCNGYEMTVRNVLGAS